ncbi:MAG: tetratricopeptide repeat protein, partial [Nitrospinales bacterium]
LNAWLDGMNPFGYHLFNLTFHMFNSMMIYFITLNALRYFHFSGNPFRRKEMGYIALVVSLFFLCHPIQTESVVYIVSRSEVLSATCYLGAFLVFQICFDRDRRPSILFRFLIAPLMILGALYFGFSVKQSVITLPMMLLLYYLCGRTQDSLSIRFLKRWRYPLAVAAGVGLILLLRKLLTDEQFLIGPSNAGEIIGRKTYILTQPSVVMFYYLKLLMWPVNLNIDPGIQFVRDWYSSGFLLGFVAFIFSVILAYRVRGSRLYFFFVCWYFIVLSPSSSIITLLDMAAEHRVYLATYGFFIILAVGVYHLIKISGIKSKGIFGAAMLAGITVLLCLMSVQRNSIWTNELSLWHDTLKKSPKKVRPYINLGRAYHLAKNPDKAIYYYEESVKKDPSYFQTHYNLGDLYAQKGDTERALAHLHYAARLAPRIPEIFSRLGEIYMSQKNYPLADQYLKKAVELNPRFSEAFRNLGIVHYYYLQNKKEALTYFAQSLTLDPDQPGADQLRMILNTPAQ